MGGLQQRQPRAAAISHQKVGEAEAVSPELIQKIEAAVAKGLRVEIFQEKSGEIKAQTISRKILK